MQLSYAVQNTHRSVGTRTSSHIVRNFGMRNAFQPDHLTVKLQGSAGQSLGAFAAPGLKLEVSGDANDYVGKGLSGGTIVVRPPMSSPLTASENTIVGNTVLYGATDGYLFAAGRAGERFGVRNSGASVVIEGCGACGCEYMTGGIVAVLGPVGVNFGAGMTGGFAYLYDEGDLDRRVNPELVEVLSIDDKVILAEHLRGLINQHYEETGSQFSLSLLHDFASTLSKFKLVKPKTSDVKNLLGHISRSSAELRIQAQ
jgi:glutamate synthase (NADPH/NADH) large chain